MSNYRRLISYIYAYEGEVKGKNIGFVKLESRGGQCKLSVNVKKVYVGGSDLGVYLLAPGREISLGNIFIRSGAGEFRAVIPVENVADSGIGMDSCYGLSIHEPSDGWRCYTTIWEDAVAHAAEVELADVTSKSRRDISEEEEIHKKAEEIAAELDMPVDKVREILRVAQEPVSLETPIGEEEDSHLGDFIPDDDALAPADAASMLLLKEQLGDVLKTLTPREEKVLSLRFGLEDGHPRTLEEVGKEFNVTRERIRQIEAKALRKLRHPSRSKKLKDFLD